ncbi:hypothetical protein, partial [Escherichia coli]|uniref:hypothetical protein n=1 Tax=Escherichia coli TaxID=562 RepID=UPI00273FC9BD
RQEINFNILLFYQFPAIRCRTVIFAILFAGKAAVWPVVIASDLQLYGCHQLLKGGDFIP